MTNLLIEDGIYVGQPPILFALRKKGSATQKEISEQLGISQATVAVSLKRMEAAGLISRVSDKKDMRRNRIELTSIGRELTEKCIKRINEISDVMLRDFEKSEIDKLGKYFERMLNNLKEYQSFRTGEKK